MTSQDEIKMKFWRLLTQLIIEKYQYKFYVALVVIYTLFIYDVN